jgi:hypothetical protein
VHGTPRLVLGTPPKDMCSIKEVLGNHDAVLTGSLWSLPTQPSGNALD